MYADAKNNGIEPPEYLHGIQNITQSTYHVYVYQEQLMSISKQVAGFDVSQADSLMRKAIAKKKVKMYDETFYGCDSLKEINMSPENKYYTSSDGVLFNKNKTELICCPMGKTGDYIIPNTVKIIKSPGFNCCKKLTSITIPNSVDQINDDAFGFLIDTQTIYSR